MAVIDWQPVETPHDSRYFHMVKWEGLTASDTGQPFVVAAYSDKTVQLLGNFGGSSMTIQGSLQRPDDTITWATLNDPQGNALSGISSATIENILEHVYQIRPVAAAGVTSVDVWLLLASTRGG